MLTFGEFCDIIQSVIFVKRRIADLKLSVFFHHIREGAEQKGIPLDEALSYVKKLGIDYAELDIGDLKSDDVPKALQKAGLRISSIYGFYGFDHEKFGDAGKFHCDRAKELGAEKVMIVPGFYSSLSHETIESEKAKMLSGTAEMCGYAAGKGLTPTIEDFDDVRSPIAKAEGMLEFVSAIPELKVTFDTGNFMFSAQSEIYAYELLKDNIVHVHCKDRSMTPESGCEVKTAVNGIDMYPCAVGHGCIAIGQVVKELLGRGYDGIFAIEHFGAKDQFQYMKQSAENLKGWEK
jgi:sugar phosphate isomerase/epimerase